jgi:Flp pilus assembly CpaE family ATPase
MAGLSIDDVARAVGTRSIHQLPTGGAALTRAVNEGRPPVVHQPKSPYSRALYALYEQVRTRIADPAVRR